jgi:hypothetical protein
MIMYHKKVSRKKRHRSVKNIRPKRIFGCALQRATGMIWSPMQFRISIEERYLIGSRNDNVKKKYDSSNLAAKTTSQRP